MRYICGFLLLMPAAALAQLLGPALGHPAQAAKPTIPTHARPAPPSVLDPDSNADVTPVADTLTDTGQSATTSIDLGLPSASPPARLLQGSTADGDDADADAPVDAKTDPSSITDSDGDAASNTDPNALPQAQDDPMSTGVPAWFIPTPTAPYDPSAGTAIAPVHAKDGTSSILEAQATGRPPPATTQHQGSKSLNSGQCAAIGLGAFAACGLVLVLGLSRRRLLSKEDSGSEAGTTATLSGAPSMSETASVARSFWQRTGRPATLPVFAPPAEPHKWYTLQQKALNEQWSMQPSDEVKTNGGRVQVKRKAPGSPLRNELSVSRTSAEGAWWTEIAKQ
ncbi:hypothetical protein EXIGLDRAFT_730889 [Exidia glandulosa HHB12029]|uniref:Uncharacterized protein n=1 Tax=Exidia glandulosa HHB12029 TaxID=1314781 RepID=A0A165PWV4_EXIGL|nr:hypothetical protein EXIGLDRAFT_730889 [Exidia glandulosa HHB12029]